MIALNVWLNKKRAPLGKNLQAYLQVLRQSKDQQWQQARLPSTKKAKFKRQEKEDGNTDDEDLLLNRVKRQQTD